MDNLISVPKPITATLEDPKEVIVAEDKDKPVINERNDDIDFITALAKSYSIKAEDIHIEYLQGFKIYTYNGHRLFRQSM